MLLEDAGYEVEIYDDADVAVDRAVASGAEIIVAGFQSASHSGLEIPSAVRPHDIKVIVATADPDEDTAHLAADKGVYALVRRGSLRESELSSVLAGLKQPA
jgi:DNA-binding NtrC family response regulator